MQTWLLREAGLLNAGAAGRGKVYRLRREGLKELESGLDRFLLG